MKRISWLLCAVMVVLFVSVGVVCANDLSGSDVTYREMITFAWAGNADAQTAIGYMYYAGQGGVVQDYQEALKWFSLAAEKGNASAEFNLGLIYQGGHGVTQDSKQAEHFFRKAAEKGLPEAQINLGMMYYNGLGVVQDYNEAMRWHKKLAEQGNAEAQAHLGVMYGLGQGVAQDFVQSHLFFNVAAANGKSDAGGLRDRIAQMMTSEQIAEAQRLAREWMEKYQQ